MFNSHINDKQCKMLELIKSQIDDIRECMSNEVEYIEDHGKYLSKEIQDECGSRNKTISKSEEVSEEPAEQEGNVEGQ